MGMKKALAGRLFILSLLFLSGCKQVETKPEEIQYAGLDCIVVESRDSDEIMKLFEQMQAEGKVKGYCPLIIMRDEQTPGGRSVLDEWLEIQAGDNGSLPEYTQSLLNEYQDIEVETYFDDMSDYYQEMSAWEAGEGRSYIEDLSGIESQNDLYTSYIEDIYIARVPTDKPYEVLAYVPIGGYNDCPPAGEHIAIAEKWYEEYGAVPCAVSYDIVQFYLETPVTDDTALDELTREQFIYCYDIVLQGVGSLEGLKKSLDGSRFWFFWWD